MKLAAPKLAAFAGLLALLPMPLYAEIVPQAGRGDPHIQTVAYDPDEVVALHVASGYAVTVQFSPDERIETVTVGDAAAWQVQVNRRADHLVVKANGFALPSNLTVLTDQRSYSFALYESSANREWQPYLVSFTYGGAPAGPSAAAVPAQASYKLRGDRTLWPVAISDDGAFTSLRWPEDATLPAIYLEDERKHLALVNGVMRDGSYVVEGVHSHLVFVLGRARARAERIAGSPAP